MSSSRSSVLNEARQTIVTWAKENSAPKSIDGLRVLEESTARKEAVLSDPTVFWQCVAEVVLQDFADLIVEAASCQSSSQPTSSEKPGNRSDALAKYGTEFPSLKQVALSDTTSIPSKSARPHRRRIAPVRVEGHISRAGQDTSDTPLARAAKLSANVQSEDRLFARETTSEKAIHNTERRSTPQIQSLHAEGTEQRVDESKSYKRVLNVVEEAGSRVFNQNIAILHAMLIAKGISTRISRSQSILTVVQALDYIHTSETRSQGGASTCSLPNPSADLRSVLRSPLFRYLKPPGYGLSKTDLAIHSTRVLNFLCPMLIMLPFPICTAFRDNLAMRIVQADIISLSFSSLQATFPSAQENWTVSPRETPLIALEKNIEQEPEDLSSRLVANLESSWDAVLDLQRRHRGDISSIAPGTLDIQAAIQVMSSLHPANMDSFAKRFLQLLLSSALHGKGKSAKKGQLDERLRQATGSAQRTFARSGASAFEAKLGHLDSRHSPTSKVVRLNSKFSSSTGSNQSSGVILHRLPDAVRDIFHQNPAELFFFDFMLATDSFRLMSALSPRLSWHLMRSLESASRSSTNVEFTDTVLAARLLARFLSVTLHFGNWSHSALSLTGDKYGLGGHTLPESILKLRAEQSSLAWSAVIDVDALLRNVERSGNVPAALASAAVIQIIVRLAIVDPVAEHTRWFRTAVEALQRFMSLIESDQSEMNGRFPLILSAILEDTLECAGYPLRAKPQTVDLGSWSEGTIFSPFQSHGSPEIGLGDIRFIRECLPKLDSVRCILCTGTNPVKAKNSARRITPVRAYGITNPLPVTGTNQGKFATTDSISKAVSSPRASTSPSKEDPEETIQERLLSEFVSKLDIRLKDVARLAVSVKRIDPIRVVDVFSTAAKALCPDTHETVINTAAHWCATEVQNSQLATVDEGEKEDEIPKVNMEAVSELLSGSADPDDVRRFLQNHGICSLAPEAI